MALSEATKEIIWIRRLLEELGYPQKKPTILYADNQGSIKLTKNPVMHKQTRLERNTDS